MFTVTFETENAAFEDNNFEETARILRHIADQLEKGYASGVARDVNGNTVGDYSLD